MQIKLFFTLYRHIFLYPFLDNEIIIHFFFSNSIWKLYLFFLSFTLSILEKKKRKK